jgi:transcription antitermination factor NusG
MINTSLHPWFAVQTRPRYEKLVATQLERKGYQLFLPTYAARRRWSDRMKVVVLPLFEGYLFCRLDLERAAPVITTAGVVRLVGFGAEPIAIDEQEIAALQRAVSVKAEMEPWPSLSVGQRVRIAQGPLTGVEGMLESVRGRDRLILSVTLLQRAVAVEIERDAVVPIDERLQLAAALA